MTFHTPFWFVVLGAITPLLLLLYRYGQRLQARRLAHFVAPRLHGLLVMAVNVRRQKGRLLLLLLALVFLAASLGRPLWRQKEEEVAQVGADFMIALDASNSMLARDMAPDHNRLAAAKRAIRELMGSLAGDRMGIVAFAGEARMLTPMTFNYGDLELVLDGIDTETLWRQGSDIARAIKTAAHAFRRKNLESRVLVIISDGENLEGDPVMAARDARVRDNLTIFTVGVGTAEGGKILVEQRDKGGNVIGSENLRDQDDEEVVSRLDEQVLRSIAQVTGGAYLRLGSRALDAEAPSAFNDLYESQIRPLATSVRSARIVAREEAFQVPLAVALLLLFVRMLVFERKRTGSRAAAGRTTALMLAAGLLCLAGGALQAAEGKRGRLLIPYCERPPHVDGELSDWRPCPRMPLPFMNKDTSSVRLAWHETGLYGALDVDDTDIKINLQNPWTADCFELFIEKDNKLDHEAAADDHEVEQYVFFPDPASKLTTRDGKYKTGPAYWMIPLGIHRTDGARKSDAVRRDEHDRIVCAFKSSQWAYGLEFFIPAAMLDPAVMKGRTQVTLNFCLSADGWPSEQFACDKNVKDSHRRPVTWRTVMFAPRPQDAAAGPVPEAHAEPATDTPVAAEEEAEQPERTAEERDAAIVRAERLMRTGRPHEAAQLLQEELHHWPDHPYLLYNYGVASYACAKFATAEFAWTKVTMLKESALHQRALFQLGNVAFRRAYALEANPRAWDNAIALYHRAAEYYEKVDSDDLRLQDALKQNLRATAKQLVTIHLARGAMHLEKAEKAAVFVSTNRDARAWRVAERIEELVGEAQRAGDDFRQARELAPRSSEALKGIERVAQLLEDGFLTKARALRREVDEVGSTQNEIWTVEKYQASISCFDRVLAINPANKAAREERKAVQDATRDVYMQEAGVEREMARRILKERGIERDLEKRIEEMRKLPGADRIKELAYLENKLRWVKTRYPPGDPEEAIKHWENAVDDYKIALTFTLGDPMVEKEAGEVYDTIYQFRKDLAEQYVKEARRVKVTNDEEADEAVKKLELAVGHVKRAQEMKPKAAAALAPRLARMKKVLARSYKNRGDIYRGLADKRRVQFLDRAVAYMEKANQDYVFATRMDPALTAAEEAHEATKKEVLAMRLELSKRIADIYEEEAEAGLGGPDLEVTIDEAKLRELALQERDEAGEAGRSYDTERPPQPVLNW